MTYLAFQKVIREELVRLPAGATWKALRDTLDLPYRQPCPEWIKRLEQDIGLVRSKGSSRAYQWRLE